MTGLLEERATKLTEFFELARGRELIAAEDAARFDSRAETTEGLAHFNIEWHIIPSEDAVPLDDAYLARLYPLAPRDFARPHEHGPSYRDRLVMGHRQHQGRIVGVETTQKPRYLPGNRQFYGSFYGQDAT